MNAERPWINVSEKLPPVGQLVETEKAATLMLRYRAKLTAKGLWWSDQNYRIQKPDAWRPLADALTPNQSPNRGDET